MEKRIKEQQLDLFSVRTSSLRWPSQLRLKLSSFGYTLAEGLRRLALRGTRPFARPNRIDTITEVTQTFMKYPG